MWGTSQPGCPFTELYIGHLGHFAPRVAHENGNSQLIAKPRKKLKKARKAYEAQGKTKNKYNSKSTG